MHVVAPNGAYVPALQFAHVLPTGTCPGKHGAQNVDPTLTVKVPDAHSTHAGLPGDDA